MLVSIIIVNYNTFTLTCNCIRSVVAHTTGVAYEIVLVDNASTECAAALFEETFPQIKIVACAENGGFARGNNAGITVATGDVILLLNSDTVLEEDAVSKAAHYLLGESRTGALTLRLRYPDGRVQHYARRYKSLKFELLDLTRPLLYLLPYRRRASLMLNQYYKGDFDVVCDWVGGAFMMLPRAAINSLPAGKLDERFFMYGEDQLWCMQLAAREWEVRCFSGAEVIHLEGGSNKASAGRKWRGALLRRELELYRLRWGQGTSYWGFALVFTFKRAVAFALLKVLGK
jgi:GT2 family glycosyltransferase